MFAKNSPIPNLDSSVVPLLKLIDEIVIENKYNCRTVGLEGFTNLIDLCLRNASDSSPSMGRCRTGFKNLAAKYIKFLKKTYLAMDSTELNAKGEAKAILNCIRAFSAICKGGSI